MVSWRGERERSRQWADLQTRAGTRRLQTPIPFAGREIDSQGDAIDCDGRDTDERYESQSRGSILICE